MLFKQIVLIIFFLIPHFAYSLEENIFVVSIRPVILKNIDSNFSHLANSIPMLIYDELQNTILHHYSSEELSILGNEKLEFNKIENLKILTELKDKYDKYFFSQDFNIEQYKLLGNDITKQKYFLENLNIANVESNLSSDSIKYILADSDSNYTEKKDIESIDLIIKGEIEKLDNWIYIQFWVENTILNTENLVYKSVSSTDNLVNLIPEISSKLKTEVLGRSWSNLKFTLEPNDTRVVVKNNTDIILEKDYENLYPGIYDIELSKTGYYSKQITVEIKEFEILKIETSLDIKENAIISLQSFPAGADLYSGATWIGKTPLLIKSPIIPSLLTLKYEGYNDSKYIYNNSSGRDIQIFMESALIDHELIIQNKRNTFYKSFSYFLLSIPVSMISFGISSDYAYAYEREVFPSSETERLQQLSNTWYNVYLGGMFINITLFVNTLFDLVDYIKSNDFL